jgi:hypothetical protein
MKQYFYLAQFLLTGLFIAAFLTGCEIETMAFGTVSNSKTGGPVVGAHVIQLAVSNKTADVVNETFTDSLGNFYMDSGLAGFGLRSVNLQIVVEKDSFGTALVENNYGELKIQLRPY